MGYVRKSMQILGGGFSILPPADKIPITDYVLCQNFRADSLGRLVGRAGYQTAFFIDGAGIAHSCFNAGGAGDPYYVGCNSDVQGTITSSLYYDNQPTPIATGFDGRRIGFAAQNGAVWVMNRGLQGRYDPGDPNGFQSNYVFTAPVSAPTASTAGSLVTVPSATFTFAVQGDPNYQHFITIAGMTYTFAENGYAANQIPQVLASLAVSDPNCMVTNPDVNGTSLVITPRYPAVVINVSASDGNAPQALLGGSTTTLPNGTYVYYLTFFQTTTGLESNGSPGSFSVTTDGPQSISVTIPLPDDLPTDPRIDSINIYRSGGTQSAINRVQTIPLSEIGNVYMDSMPDTAVSASPFILPTQNDPAPACSGMIGPFYGRLVSWSTAANKNRLFWTNADVPQYWPGSGDPQAGNWVDVGLDNEEIVWCSIHTNLLVIYKERSIWLQIGDFPSAAIPQAGQLEQEYDGIGLAGQWALAPAGQIDYFVGPNGLYLNDMSQVHEITGNILPLFNQNLTNDGTSRTPPGSILPGSAFNPASTDVYAVALGHAMGRLYIAYAEQATPNNGWNLLVEDEGSEPETQAFFARRQGRWFYHRNNIANTLGFFGWFFDGNQMIGLTGAPGQAAQGFSVADFRGFLTQDPGPVQIDYTYQSHYEDAGLPDNDKMWLEVAIDAQIDAGVAGPGANCYVYFNNGLINYGTFLGNIPSGPRATVTFPLALSGSGLPGSMDDGYLAKNASIQIDLISIGGVEIHNIYLYYYVEARLGLVASTIPSDLGVGKIKECKELHLDINAYGPAGAYVVSDLPGNALAARNSLINIAQSTGRGIIKYPFPVTEGLLWQVALEGGPFRLYGARLLMRVIGVYIEGYESAAGFVWDSMQVPLGDGDVFTLDSLRFDMQAGGQTDVQLYTDLPGETSVYQGVFSLGSAATQRAWVTVPLPQGIEARSVQIQVTGNSGFRIYQAQVRAGHVGRYMAVLPPDRREDAFIASIEFDFRTEKRKVFKRLEIDMRADGNVNLAVITDQDGAPITTLFAVNLSTPNGREAVMVPLPPGLRGRLFTVQLESPSAARIYNIRVLTRAVSEPAAAWAWEDFPLESSDVIPSWHDLISVEPTSPVWTLVDIPFEVTNG